MASSKRWRPLTDEEIAEVLQNIDEDSDCDVDFSSSNECSSGSDTEIEDDAAEQLLTATPSTSVPAVTWQDNGTVREPFRFVGVLEFTFNLMMRAHSTSLKTFLMTKSAN